MYINLLTQIKNAQHARKEKLKVPYTKMDMAILEILSNKKLVGEISKKGRPIKRSVEIKLNYNDGRGIINDVKFISKPSRRIYASYKDLKPVKQGYGFGIISTSRGIMTTSDARKQKLGGQVLFEIW